MNTLLILLLILHTSTSAFSIISGDPANTTVLASAPPPPPPPTWSGFYLSLLWPPGYCLIHNICDRHKIKEDFTIHGLWPQTPAGQQLPSAPLYDDSLVIIITITIIIIIIIIIIYPSLRRNLRRNWPNYRRRSRDEAFWRHEWNQHGREEKTFLERMRYNAVLHCTVSSLRF
nr:ribonuclease MC-like [Ipomoea batatas]